MNNKADRIRLILGVAIVTLSLLLVLVVGYGQALKSYRQLTTDAVMAQTEAARLGIEKILQSGVPLDNIAGLSKVLQPIVDANESVIGLHLFAGQQEFYQFGQVGDYASSISITLNNKFTQVGTLKVSLADELVEETVFASFQPFLLIVIVLLIAFVASVVKSKKRTVYLTSFTVVFMVMSVGVMLLVGSLYRDGLLSKSVSLADAVSQRLSPILFYSVTPDLVDGIDSMLDNFRHSNPELSQIGVFKDTHLIASSQQGNSMVQVLFDNGALEYAISTSDNTEVRLSYHAKVVLAQLVQILKSFAMLFFACGLVCFAFIRLLIGESNQQKNDQVLERIKPLFLGAVLMEALMAPIMPQYMTSVVDSAGLSTSASAFIFALYFLGFAMALLPAAKLLEKYAMRQVLIVGILLSSLGCVLLALDLGVWTILVARFGSGIGQALIFITVQGYILKFSNKNNKTQAAGIIVFCFNAGFIAGVAIGALLADYLGDKGTFILAACIGIAMTLLSFILPLMPVHKPRNDSVFGSVSEMMTDAWRLMKVPTFVRTILLVGIPTKIALTGIVTFAVPLFLSQRGVSNESIGQVLMSYAVIVLIISHKIGPWVDKFNGSKKALVFGNLVAGCALTLLSVAVIMPEIWAVMVLMTMSMILLGLAHGLINAPVVTHVVMNLSDGKKTHSSIAATYRFVERIGHISGSIIVAQMLLWFGIQVAMLILAGFFVSAFIVFAVFERQGRKVVLS